MKTLISLNLYLLSSTPYGDNMDAPDILRSFNPVDWLLFVVWFFSFILFEVILPIIDYIIYSGEPAAVGLVVFGLLLVLYKTVYAWLDPDVTMFGYTD